MNKIYERKQKLYNMLANCRKVNNTKCEYCKRQCKEYKEYLEIKEKDNGEQLYEISR